MKAHLTNGLRNSSLPLVLSGVTPRRVVVVAALSLFFAFSQVSPESQESPAVRLYPGIPWSETSLHGVTIYTPFEDQLKPGWVSDLQSLLIQLDAIGTGITGEQKLNIVVRPVSDRALFVDDISPVESLIYDPSLRVISIGRSVDRRLLFQKITEILGRERLERFRINPWFLSGLSIYYASKYSGEPIVLPTPGSRNSLIHLMRAPRNDELLSHGAASALMALLDSEGLLFLYIDKLVVGSTGDPSGIDLLVELRGVPISVTEQDLVRFTAEKRASEIKRVR